jgi:hypothetical protein
MGHERIAFTTWDAENQVVKNRERNIATARCYALIRRGRETNYPIRQPLCQPVGVHPYGSAGSYDREDRAVSGPLTAG